MSLEHLNQQQREALERLVQFSVKDWCGWIRCLLDGEECEPELGLSTSPHRVLIWLYEKGLKRTARFVEAVGLIYESTTGNRPRQLFYMLQAISVIRPGVCKDFILRQLKNHRLDRVVFEGFDLKALALMVRAGYGIDDKLLAFIERSAWEAEDFSYRLAAFRIWAKYDVFEAFDSFELLLADLVNADQRKIFGGILRGISWVETCLPLYDWFFSDRGNALREKNPRGFRHLTDALREWVFPWRPSEFSDDPYAVLFSARLAAGRWPFSAEELLIIAKSADHWLLRNRLNDVQSTLSMIWDASEAHIRTWYQSPRAGITPPWGISLESPYKLYTNLKPEAIEQAGREYRLQEVPLGKSRRVFFALSRSRRSAFVSDARGSSQARQLEVDFEEKVATAAGR